MSIVLWEAQEYWRECLVLNGHLKRTIGLQCTPRIILYLDSWDQNALQLKEVFLLNVIRFLAHLQMYKLGFCRMCKFSIHKCVIAQWRCCICIGSCMPATFLWGGGQHCTPKCTHFQTRWTEPPLGGASPCASSERIRIDPFHGCRGHHWHSLEGGSLHDHDNEFSIIWKYFSNDCKCTIAGTRNGKGPLGTTCHPVAPEGKGHPSPAHSRAARLSPCILWACAHDLHDVQGMWYAALALPFQAPGNEKRSTDYANWESGDAQECATFRIWWFAMKH